MTESNAASDQELVKLAEARIRSKGKSIYLTVADYRAANLAYRAGLGTSVCIATKVRSDIREKAVMSWGTLPLDMLQCLENVAAHRRNYSVTATGLHTDLLEGARTVNTVNTAVEKLLEGYVVTKT